MLNWRRQRKHSSSSGRSSVTTVQALSRFSSLAITSFTFRVGFMPTYWGQISQYSQNGFQILLEINSQKSPPLMIHARAKIDFTLFNLTPTTRVNLQGDHMSKCVLKIENSLVSIGATPPHHLRNNIHFRLTYFMYRKMKLYITFFNIMCNTIPGLYWWAYYLFATVKLFSNENKVKKGRTTPSYFFQLWKKSFEFLIFKLCWKAFCMVKEFVIMLNYRNFFNS